MPESLGSAVLTLDADSKPLDAKLAASEKATEARLQAMGARMRKAGSSLAATGATMTRKLTLPILAAGTAVGVMGARFEDEMQKIVGLVGVSQKQVDEWGKQIIDLAPKVGKSPQELAEAMFVVTSAGVRGAAAMDTLTVAAKASAAGLGETKDIARVAAGAINAYGKENIDAGRATEILVATARAGNFETNELAGSLGRVLPFAKEAGAGFEDVGGAIALVTRTSGDAASAVDQVGSLLRAFSAPTKQTQVALEDLGLTTDEVRTSMAEEGLVGTLQMLDERLDGNRDKLREIIPDSTGFAAALQILNADAKSLDDTFGQVENSVGIVDEAFKAAAESSGFTARQLKAEFQAKLVEMSGSVLKVGLPALAALGGALALLAAGFTSLPGPIQTTIVVLLAATAAAGPLVTVIGRLVQGIGLLVSALGLLRLSALASSLETLAIHWLILKDRIKAVWLLLRAHPYAVLATATVAIAALIIKNWDQVKQALSATWRAIKTTAIKAWNAILAFFKRWWPLLLAPFTAGLSLLVGLIVRNWDRVSATTRSVWEAIRRFIVNPTRAAFEWVRGAVRDLAGWLSTRWKAISGGVRDFAGNLRDRIVSAIEGAVAKVKDFINAIIRVVNKLPFVKIGELATGGTVSRAGVTQELATGGRVTRPMAIVGEEAPRHPEFVIPTNPAYRGRAVALTGMLLRELGMAGVPGFGIGGIVKDVAGKVGGIAQDAVGIPLDILKGGAQALIKLLPNPADMLPGWLVGLGKHVIARATSFIKDKVGDLLGGLVGGIAPGKSVAGTNAKAALLARLFGLTIQSGYRSPAHNAAVGGVPNSSHTRGSPSNPGAHDFTPPSAAALGYALKHLGAMWADIHDFGSGLHLHVSWFRRGGILDRMLHLPFLGSAHEGGIATREGLAHVTAGESMIPPGSRSLRSAEFVITNWREGRGYFREVADEADDERDRAGRARFSAGLARA